MYAGWYHCLWALASSQGSNCPFSQFPNPSSGVTPMARLVSLNWRKMRSSSSPRFAAGFFLDETPCQHVHRWGRTCFVLEMNTFSAVDERIWHWTRKHLSLEKKAFSAGDKGVWYWRLRRLAPKLRRLALETKAFSAGD